MDIRMIATPLIGAVIGYITNDIAIRMLFHPRHAVYIGKWKVPLTPGLIPKEKDRIAVSIGDMVGAQLLDAETLERVFVSDAMHEKLRERLYGLIEDNRENESRLGDLLLKVMPEETAGQIEEDVKNDIAGLIHGKLTELGFGESIARAALVKIKEKTIFGAFGSGSGAFIDSMSKSIGEIIDRVIASNSKEIITEQLGAEIDKVKDCTVEQVIAKYEDKLYDLADIIIGSYDKIITGSLPKILESVDVAKIVRDKIDSFDVEELETMLLALMKKELRAIVYLGALLGFIMGCLNLLIL